MVSLSFLLLGVTVVCVALLLTGVPIYLVFGLWVVGFHLFVPTFPLSNISITAFTSLQSFPFIAIPLFIIVGDLIYEANISEQIIDLAQSLGGWLPGTAGNTVLLTAGIFSAITGSNAATTASVGKALMPALESEGYETAYASAVVASGGTVGVIIPPSIILIIYGITFSVSIPKLFLAGIIPGISMVIGMVTVNVLVAKRRGYGRSEYSFSLRDVIRNLWRAKVGIGTIVVLLGGIYSGFFTPSESAAVATLYLVFAGVITGNLTSLEQIKSSLFTAIFLVGIIIPVVVMSILIQQNLTYLNVSQVISEAVVSLHANWLIIPVMAVIMLVSGSVLASVPNLVLVAPLLAGAAASVGLSPIEWGVIFCISDAIGFITPPYGLNLYVISGMTGVDYINVARQAVGYLFVLVVIWLLFFVFPSLNVLVS